MAKLITFLFIFLLSANMAEASTMIKFLKEAEGLRLEAYKDANKQAIGYGNTHNVKVGDKITKKEAEALLRKTIIKYKKIVESNVRVNLNYYQLIALVSLTYNIGETAFKNSTLLKKLNNGDYIGAANEFDRWIYVNHKKSQGLINRRKKEKELFLRK